MHVGKAGVMAAPLVILKINGSAGKDVAVTTTRDNGAGWQLIVEMALGSLAPSMINVMKE